MPRSRRSSYHVEAEITPAPAPAGWLSALGNVPIAVVLTALVSFGGFYAISNQNDARHDAEITALKLWKEQSGPALQSRLEQEGRDRAAVRNEFLANQARTTEILAKMDSRLAVSETKQEAGNQTLNKIADELARLNARSNGRTR